MKKEKSKTDTNWHDSLVTPGVGNAPKGCMFPQCGKKVTGRGLCQYHNHVVSTLVKEGATTYEELEKAGKTLPNLYQRRRIDSRSWFLAGTPRPVVKD